MYHGTSSAFLSSILKHGLLPNVKHKSFGGDDEAYHSLGGVYITTDKDYASEAAFTAIGTYPGIPILITVQYVIGSGGLDEDLFFERCLYVMKQNAYEYINIASDSTIFKLANKCLYILKDNVKPTNKTKHLMNLFCRTYIESFNNKEYTHHDMILNPKLRKIIVWIIESTKDTLDTNEVRITRPIKFKGKTRILKINELKLNRRILYQDRNFDNDEEEDF